MIWLSALLPPSILVAAIWALARWALKQGDMQSAVVARLCYDLDSRAQAGRNSRTDASKRLPNGVSNRASPASSKCNRQFLHSAMAPLVALAVVAVGQPAQSHEISGPRGASRQAGFDHCAKGACLKRFSYSPGVPHRHVGSQVCEGQGAAGYTFGCRFQC